MTGEGMLVLDGPAIAGSGFVASLLFLALVEKLRRTFATRAELDGMGSRLTGLQSLYLQAREAADEARERSVAVEREQKHQWERIAEQVIRPLEKITDKLEAVGGLQAAQAAALEHILQRLDRLDAGPGPRTTRKRRTS